MCNRSVNIDGYCDHTPLCLVRREVVVIVAGAGQTDLDLEYRTEWLVVVVV